MARPPYYPGAVTLFDELAEPPSGGPIVPSDAAPPGIPPPLWAQQMTDTIVSTPQGQRAAYPGQQVTQIALPLRYTRPWRLIISPTFNRDDGQDPLIDPQTHEPIQPDPLVWPPTVNNPANDPVGARLVLRIGADLCMIDYPGRGATLAIESHRLEAYVYELESPGSGSARPRRYHVQAQQGTASRNWAPLTLTHASVSEPLASGPGFETYLMTAIPVRARSMRLICNSDALFQSSPQGIVTWHAIDGAIVESFQLTQSNSPNNPTWLWANGDMPWPVPFGAAFFVFTRNTQTGGNWDEPNTIWQIAL